MAIAVWVPTRKSLPDTVIIFAGTQFIQGKYQRVNLIFTFKKWVKTNFPNEKSKAMLGETLSSQVCERTDLREAGFVPSKKGKLP